MNIKAAWNADAPYDNESQLLRRVLFGNAAFSTLTGLLCLFDATALTRAFAIPDPLLLPGLGVQLLIFATAIVWVATRTRLPITFAWTIICLVRLGGSAFALAGVDGKSIGRFTQHFQAPFPRFASRSTAFERHLRKRVFGELTVDQVARKGLEVVLNAAELSTGTAFRFGSQETGTWRFGRLAGAPPYISKAVAASACFPALLPAIDEFMDFEKDGQRTRHRVMLTDGGIYDNLGLTCLLPGRSAEFSTNVSNVDFIIACDAGQGMPSGLARPYLWSSRMLMTVNTIHRRTHSLSYELLHRMKDTGQIKGFLLPYLGQVDERLPYIPDDLVRRHETFDYPTDFNSMKEADIERLGMRGEQLTRLLFERYQPDV